MTASTQVNVLLPIAMSTSTPILSADFPHAMARGSFPNLRLGATLTFKLIVGF